MEGGRQIGGGNSAMAIPPCWANRATAGRCIMDVSVQEVVQPSDRREHCLVCFFSGLPGDWSRARAWRQVEVARSTLESLAAHSTRDLSGTLLASEILIDFGLTGTHSRKSIEFGVILRHFKSGLCFPQASARLIAQSIELHLQAEECRIRCVREGLCGLLSLHTCPCRVIFD